MPAQRTNKTLFTYPVKGEETPYGKDGADFMAYCEKYGRLSVTNTADPEVKKWAITHREISKGRWEEKTLIDANIATRNQIRTLQNNIHTNNRRIENIGKNLLVQLKNLNHNVPLLKTLIIKDQVRLQIEDEKVLREERIKSGDYGSKYPPIRKISEREERMWRARMCKMCKRYGHAIFHHTSPVPIRTQPFRITPSDIAPITDDQPLEEGDIRESWRGDTEEWAKKENPVLVENGWPVEIKAEEWGVPTGSTEKTEKWPMPQEKPWGTWKAEEVDRSVWTPKVQKPTQKPSKTNKKKARKVKPISPPESEDEGWWMDGDFDDDPDVIGWD
ncbi:hypothetical protein EST38_g13773 [Candolleomyces aberdarensis]|uniref:Uncharacterized protein n=1 Tax=Candolleomyces aberdarensis TaxID=2316362 RepID=A0A4Q2D1D9_9AGAR|nr:hypothetical protein EST38_g13773 [Candolleomyces aberdarensis]